MPRLNQVIAAEGGVRSRLNEKITSIYQDISKSALLTGINRTYSPKDDDGETLPPESTLVQMTAETGIEQARQCWSELWNLTLTKDAANMEAAADIIIDDETIVPNVPVTTLLFLEKQLVDLRTFVSKIPVHDPSKRWSMSSAGDGVWESEPRETARTKKVKRNHVKAEATDKHMAQVETYDEDVIVGFWKTIDFTGAIPARRRDEMLARIEQLIRAVKFAREEANTKEVSPREMADALFDFVLS